MIISVSRRCDIPRFQFDWFMQRLDAGFIEVANPFNASQIKRIPLVPVKEGMKPDDGVEVFIFWTRDPRHILANADELHDRGFPFYVMVSVTGYPSLLEPNMIPASEAIICMKELAQKIGADKVIWRYDPVILTNITNEEFHCRNFKYLAQNISGSVKQVIISIFDEYKSVMKRFSALEKEGKLLLRDNNIDNDNFYGILLDMYECALDAKMEVQSCAEKINFRSIGINIKPGACIDAALIEKIRNVSRNEFSGLKPSRDKNQRPDCLCCKSIDIGTYKTCKAGCVYCYAS
ncbi:MAG: DUF1848 domain-containing protein [Treponema sp.]|nr:DUF1848 domain-containing protein [Treponema sp.]MCL2272589.1 DUF1848 domain-containing protein [Treponema sp.]